jgi:transcriptional regulator with XRE-family HTH domain
VNEETLGQRIRKVRQARGMTLAQVAGGEFSRAFLNQVEMGRSQPSTRVLRVIATRLGTPIDYLVGGSSRLEDLERAVESARLALERGEVEKAKSILEEVRQAEG